MDPFATLEDISILWRELKESEYSKAEKLLTVVSDSLRYEANKVGKDLDNMIEQNEALRNVAKSVTVDVVARTLMTSTDTEPMTQMSQSALGYSVTGTWIVLMHWKSMWAILQKPIKAARMKLQSLSLPWTVSSQMCCQHCSVMAQRKLIQKTRIQNRKGKERMNDMTTFIARMIMREADKSTAAGQKKYRAYFVRTSLYKNWKDDVDTILKTDGYDEIIVED